LIQIEVRQWREKSNWGERRGRESSEEDSNKDKGGDR
jgi:hypothetical protein